MRTRYICSVFFDLSKAFNKVPHSTLIHKVVDLNLNPYLIRWIVGCGPTLDANVRNYLTGRQQAVVCWMEWNRVFCLSSQVFLMQGSVLCSLLFLIPIELKKHLQCM